MTDHRRRAENRLIELLDQHSRVNNIAIGCQAALAHDLLPFLASALKEVEEETWARAVEVVEKLFVEAGFQPHKEARILERLREEAAKK